MKARWTRKAIAYGTLAGALVVLGMLLPNAILVLAGGGMGALLVLAAVQPLGHTVATEHALDKDKVLEDDQVVANVRLSSESRRSRVLEVRDRLHPALKVAQGKPGAMGAVRSGQPLELHFTLECPIAGVYDVGLLDVSARDTFGLREARSVAGDGTSLLVYPKREMISSPIMRSAYPRQTIGAYAVRRAGVGMDFHALRGYTPSDEMRMVDWKASARKGSLIVREYEHESPAEATVFVDARAVTGLGTVEDNTLVHGVRAAASIAEQLLSDRNSVRLVVYGSTLTHLHPGSGERHLHQLLDALAAARPAGTDTFGDVATIMIPRLKPRSPAFLVSPLVDDDSIMDGASRLMAQGSSFTVVSVDPAACLAAIDEEEMPDRDLLAAHLKEARQPLLDRIRALGAKAVDWDGKDRMTAAMEQEGAG